MDEIHYASLNHFEKLVTIEDVLSLRDRTVLFYYLKGYTYREIGRKLSISVGTVHNVIKRIRKKVEQSCK